MKTDDHINPTSTPIDDDKLGNLLREIMPKAGENEWFTPRLLNRLPAKRERRFSSMAVGFYAAAVVMCIAAWWYLLTNADFMVVTVADLLKGGVMVLVTIVLVASLIHTSLTAD